MLHNLDEFARIVDHEKTAVFMPEAIPAAIDNVYIENPKWRDHSKLLQRVKSGNFFAGEFEPAYQELTSGTLIDPPPAVSEIAESLTSNLFFSGFIRRRRRIAGDEGEINVSRYIDDRDERLFVRRRRVQTTAKTVSLVGSFCFHCKQSIKRFHESAAALCAISQAIESAGYSTTIYSHFHTYMDDGFTTGLMVHLKSAGTPLNVSQLWSYARPEISRRVYLILLTMIDDYYKARFDDSLGKPRSIQSNNIHNITGDATSIYIPASLITAASGKIDQLTRGLQKILDEAANTTPEE